MLRFLIVVLVIAIYIAIGELYLLFTEHKTARGYVLSLFERRIELKDVMLNKHARKRMHVYVAVDTVLVAILAPIELIYCFIMGIITVLFRKN